MRASTGPTSTPWRDLPAASGHEWPFEELGCRRPSREREYVADARPTEARLDYEAATDVPRLGRPQRDRARAPARHESNANAGIGGADLGLHVELRKG